MRSRLFSVARLFSGVIKLLDPFATDIDLEDHDTARRSRLRS